MITWAGHAGSACTSDRTRTAIGGVVNKNGCGHVKILQHPPLLNPRYATGYGYMNYGSGPKRESAIVVE